MPFTKHVIEPIRISQCPLPAGEPNELECLSNLTLANVIRQLSSLGQHAGRIFDDLTKEATHLNNRGLIMHQRLENLKGKCQQLDIQSEEVTLADFQTKKQFKSSIKIDQQVVSRKTMPEAMKIMYNNADPPPALDKLNPYRQDGKDCMKFYTDPEFFFNIWCNELIKDNETRKIEKKRRKTKNTHVAQHQQPAQHIPKPVVKPNPQFDDIYYQQQQNYGMVQSARAKEQYYQQKQPHQACLEDHQLPPPPVHQQLASVQLNQEIYAEANQQHLKTGTTIQRTQMRSAMAQQKIYSSERPVLPPPPVPAQNHLSDLQQIQKQMIRKKQTDYGNTAGEGFNNGSGYDNNCDLPPPPSPPNNLKPEIHQMNGNNSNSSNHQALMAAQHIMKLSLTDSTNDMDMPLPPPPIDLQDSYIHNLPPPLPSHAQHINLNNLPLPPPLPPLVESDTVSTASSASPNNNTQPYQLQMPPTTPKNSSNTQVARGSYLDDINQRRFQLKSSKKEANGSNANNSIVSDGKEGADNIQPFVNNSDVAAIIDFIRKFRPHVRDSSEEDEENSDWDD